MSKPKKQKNKGPIAGAARIDSLEAAPIEGATLTPNRNRLVIWMKEHKGLAGLIALLLFVGTASALRYLDEDAKSQKLLAAKDRSMLASFNPFMPPPSPTPTPQLSKEYIYAGSRLLAVEDANANAAPPADLAVWRPSDGTWYVLGNQGTTGYTWGGCPGGICDVPVPGDFDGDGKTDFAIWRPGTTAVWYIVPSSTGSYYTVNQGQTDDIPTVADFDGDGKSDLVVYRPGNNTFYVIKSSGGTAGIAFGAGGDKPVPHDYDGDGLADYAVWRSSNHTFYTINSSNPSTGQTVDFGATDDVPVPADYDGDGKADFAIFRPSNGTWYVKRSTNGATDALQYGASTDKLVPNDYDGDGKCDRAIWRPGDGNWWIFQSATSSSRTVQWGMDGDIPVPAFYRR